MPAATSDQGRLFEDPPAEEAAQESSQSPVASGQKRTRKRAPKPAAEGNSKTTWEDESPPGEPAGEAPWITVAELARCLSTTSNAIRQWLGELPEEFKRNAGHPRKPKWQLKGKETVLWWAEHKAGLFAIPAAAQAGGESQRDPVEERLREIKLRQAELDLESRLKNFVPRDATRQWLQGLAALQRQMNEHMVKQFGNEAAVILESYLQSFEAQLEEGDASHQ